MKKLSAFAGLFLFASTMTDGIQKDTKRMMSDLAETIDIELAELPGELE